MKKILIVLALIVGTSLSAQEPPKVINISVDVNAPGNNIAIEWNTKRAKTSKIRNKAWSKNSGWTKAVHQRPGPYTYIFTKQKVTDVTYIIKAVPKNDNSNGFTKKKVRIIKIDNISRNNDNSAFVTITGKKGNLLGKTVYIGNRQYKGKVIEAIQKEWTDGPYTELTVRFGGRGDKDVAGDVIWKLEEGTYMWFKQ